MANRFPDLEKEELHKILDDKDSKNTKAAIKSAETVLMDYVKQKQLDIGEVGSRNLKDQDIFLETFYASIRKKDKRVCYRCSFRLIKQLLTYLAVNVKIIYLECKPRPWDCSPRPSVSVNSPMVSVYTLSK